MFVFLFQASTAHVCRDAAGSMFICNGGLYPDSNSSELTTWV